jgi:hypothetical protein
MFSKFDKNKIFEQVWQSEVTWILIKNSVSEVIKKMQVSTLFVDVKPEPFISVDVKPEFIFVDVKLEFVYDNVSLKFFCKVRVNVQPLCYGRQKLGFDLYIFLGGK